MLALHLRNDPSVALSTDLYELSMAQGYWKNEVAHREAAFHMFFRNNPFEGGYAVWCGLGDLLELLRDFRFTESDLDYLGSLKDAHGQPMFERGFLDYLRQMQFTCDISAVPEGTVVFPNEPLIEVRGPVLQAQVIETLLLNTVNFQTLIATKAARCTLAAQGNPVADFGLRRAQGMDGGFAASRATYVGGCASTSNVLVGKHLGIPVTGTFAHSWVMSFDSEKEAFEAFARANPNNCVFLVDTYETISGMRNAIEVALAMRERGLKPIGVRLDSGDLAYLSVEARRMLNEAGLDDMKVMVSGDLDEYLIRSLRLQGARIDAYGVGTKLVTGNRDPALGGVYKLAAIRTTAGDWDYRLKLSEAKAKISIPGLLQVYRCKDGNGKFIADAIVDRREDGQDVTRIIDPNDNTKTKRLTKQVESREPLLEPVVEQGRIVYENPPLADIRERVRQQLECLDAGHKRFENPHIYPVGLSDHLNDLRDHMISLARETANPGNGG